MSSNLTASAKKSFDWSIRLYLIRGLLVSMADELHRHRCAMVHSRSRLSATDELSLLVQVIALPEIQSQQGLGVRAHGVDLIR